MNKRLLMRLSAAMLCATILFLGMRYTYYLLFTIHHIDLTIDHRITHNGQVAISQAVHKLSEKTVACVPKILAQIKQKYPIIDTISVSFLPVNTCTIQVKGCDPVVRVNTDWVYTRQKKILAKNLLISDIIQPLAGIDMQADELFDPIISPNCAQFIDSLSASILDAYMISWISEHEIYLHDKAEQDFVMLVQSTTPLKASILAAQAIRSDFKKRGKLAHLAHTKLVVDTRFDGQIVVREEKKEGI